MSEKSRKTLVAVEQAISSILSVNKPFFGGAPDYGVKVKSVSSNGHELEIDLVFKSGVRYCCMELGCHLSFHTSADWDRFHRALCAFGADLKKPLAIHIETVVESGSLFSNLNYDRTQFRETLPNEATRHFYDFDETDCD